MMSGRTQLYNACIALILNLAARMHEFAKKLRAKKAGYKNFIEKNNLNLFFYIIVLVFL